jgi:alcohol dehydrogenase class IV
MDALCHCIESYTSARANSFSEIAGREGIRLISKYLVRAVENGSDIEAREGMMLAAALGGIAMSGALCHLSHDIGRSLGAKFHIPHGNGCAACLPQVLEAVSNVKQEQVKYFADVFGAPDAKTAAITLMRRIKLPALRDLGLDKNALLAAVPDEVVMQCRMAAKAGIITSPLPVTKELIADIVSKAYDEN